MKTPEQQQQDAVEAQEKLHSLVVAAGVLTDDEASKWLHVQVGIKSNLPANLPADAMPHECSGCGCDMSDATLLQVIISQEVGEERFHKIITLLEQGSGQEN
jgi:hypothetical protein